MTIKLFSIRRCFNVVSARNNSVHRIYARSKYDALTQGRKWFGHQCYLAQMTRCPYRYKWQLVDWLVKYKGWKRSHANKLKRNQLYAIYYAS